MVKNTVKTALSTLAGSLETVDDIVPKGSLTSAIKHITNRHHNPFYVLKENIPQNMLKNKDLYFQLNLKRKTTVRIRMPTAKEKEDICKELFDKSKSLYGPGRITLF